MGSSRAIKIQQASEKRERSFVKVVESRNIERWSVREATEALVQWFKEVSPQPTWYAIHLSMTKSCQSGLKTRHPRQKAKPICGKRWVETEMNVESDVEFNLPRHRARVTSRTGTSAVVNVHRTCIVDFDYDGEDAPLPTPKKFNRTPVLVPQNGRCRPDRAPDPIAASPGPTRLRRPGVVNVHVKPGRMSIERAFLTAPVHHMREEVMDDIATRISHGLHRGILGNAARPKRRKQAQSLPLLICQHDKRVHPHFHILVGVPSGFTEQQLRAVVAKIMKNETFRYRNGLDDPRCCVIEPVRDLASSVFYNTNAAKSVAGFPIAHLSYPRPRRTEKCTDEPALHRLNPSDRDLVGSTTPQRVPESRSPCATRVSDPQQLGTAPLAKCDRTPRSVVSGRFSRFTGHLRSQDVRASTTSRRDCGTS